MAENTKNNFLIKIESIRKTSYGGANFLKSGDIIVALNNQLYTFGEKQLTEELRELKKSNNKAILTILTNGDHTWIRTRIKSITITSIQKSFNGISREERTMTNTVLMIPIVLPPLQQL